MANELIFYESSANDQWTDRATSYSVAGLTYIGTASDGDEFNCGYRFPSVTVSQGTTVNEARLLCYVAFKGSSSDRLYVKAYGIDEDNTASFTSYPLGRTKTTAVTTFDTEMPSVGTYQEIVVTSQVNEILARGGWSSGNAMGFILNDNGSASDVYIGEDDSPGKSYLMIRESAEPNFKPTPGSVTAPTIPEAGDFGIKISKPGVNVLTATDEELYYTSRRGQLKVHMEGEVDITTTTKTIAHNLGYTPFVMLFIKPNGNTTWEKYPSFGTTGYYVNDTNLYIDGLVSGDKIYYYIFLDQLN